MRVCQERALFYSLQIYKKANQTMIQPQQLQEYFGYNSLLTQNGTRVRSLRRTEVTAQKLSQARIRSPINSTHHNFPTGSLKDKKSAQTHANRTKSRSKLSYRYIVDHSANFEREKQPERSWAIAKAVYSEQASLYGTQIESRRSFKGFLGHYYDSQHNLDFKKKTSKRSLKRLESHHSSFQSIGRILIYRQSQQFEHLSRSSNMPQIPQSTKKLKYAAEPIDPKHAQNRKVQKLPPQRQGRSELLCNADSKYSPQIGKSSLGASVVSRSSCSRQPSQAAISNEQSKKMSKGESQLSNHEGSEYGFSSNHIPPYQQPPLFYSKNELQSPKYESSKLSKGSNKASKLSLEGQRKHVQQWAMYSKNCKTSSKRRAEAVDVVTCQKDEKAGDRQMIKKSTSSDQSYKCIEADNKQSEKQPEKLCLTQSGAQTSKKLPQMVVMSETKGNRLEKEMPTVQTLPTKFNPELKGETLQGSQTSKQTLNESQISIDRKSATQKRSDIEQPCIYTSRKLSAQSGPEQLRQDRAWEQSRAKRNGIKVEQNLSSLLRNMEQHQIRLGFIYLFVDNTHQAYPGAIQFQSYERLCFLMLKKYVFEKNRVIEALRGGSNCFTLSGIAVEPETLRRHLSTPLLSEKIQDCVQEREQLLRQLAGEWGRIARKYRKDKLVKLQAGRDNFTKEIVRLLMEELTKLYQELQSDEADHDSAGTQKRITETIELMFLMSELAGRPVKHFELLNQRRIHFEHYYAQHYEKIIETHEYFEKQRE